MISEQLQKRIDSLTGEQGSQVTKAEIANAKGTEKPT